MSCTAIKLSMVVAMISFFPGSEAVANDVTDVEEPNRALVRDRFDAWRAGTGSPYDLLAENAQWTITGKSLASRTYGSREAFMTGVIRPFNARMRVALKPTITRIICEGEQVVVLFDAQGTARDGVSYANSYAWFLTIQDSKIVAATAFFDSLAFNELWTRVDPQ
jgi:ketosteroid isomerase-like protein